jgi:DNA-binding winged helix-turn-helix (wHTH) protein
MLAHLVEHRTRVVPKVELLESVWKTTFVTESALTSRVKTPGRRWATTGGPSG